MRVSAIVQTSPPRITLTWPSAPEATGFDLYRKTRDATSWGRATRLPAATTTYDDANVRTGAAYEYRIVKNTPSYQGEGYIYAGIEAPLVEKRGTVILLVDQTLAQELSWEVERLRLDLVGDGWAVIQHEAPRMTVDPADQNPTVWTARAEELAAIKSLIKSEYQKDRSNVRSVFLLGHVPVPYSGDLYPDGHTDHRGAWPVDAFYGDMDGIWPDATVNKTGASDPRNRNVPGDGKMDPTLLPSAIELAVGRVDLASLPAFTASEKDLLRRYLHKDHRFRHGMISARSRGLIDDHLGLSTTEPLAVSGWRNFASFFGASNTIAGDWLSTLATESYLWGYGCGGGTYTSVGGVITTDQLTAADPKVVFTMLFGSYHGDWDNRNNVLRAALASPTYTLTSAWAGRPPWQFHHLALGETIGFSTRVTQNNLLYDQSLARFAHVALMGDPTLRMHPVAPPSALMVRTNASGNTDLNWRESKDDLAGYAVYQASSEAGPFTRLNPGLVSEARYTVDGISSNVFMVRAVKLEVSASGSYFNASQGIFQSLDRRFSRPQIHLIEPTHGAFYVAPARVNLDVTALDPARWIERVTFYAGSLKIGEAIVEPYGFTWFNAPAGRFELTACALLADGSAITSPPVEVVIEAPLFSEGGLWRYLDDGSDPGRTWFEMDFDDALWSSGPAELGYGNSPATRVNYGGNPTNRHITTYFRTAFTVPDPGAWTHLNLGVVHDDGAAVYLNGTEVWRNNLPTGPLDNQTLALNDINGYNEWRFVMSPIDPSLLVPGLNILAAEVHQVSRSSPDLGFNLFLSGRSSGLTPILNIERQREGVDITWPATTCGYLLEWSQFETEAVWKLVTNTLTAVDGTNRVHEVILLEREFFRLTRSGH